MKKVILTFILCIAIANCASTKKKTEESTVDTAVKTTDEIKGIDAPGPAILAIEIVDSNDDNSTEPRNNTKRTIESALGYGYQGNLYTTSQGKKYMIYPYSQRDIPPLSSKADSTKLHSSSALNIQKSISYNLGTKIETAIPSKPLFDPTKSVPIYNSYPSTLYSTLGQTGIGGLSTHFPAPQPQSANVPVIILRVYSNQLTGNGIYPNLPQTHPYANNLNSINLQSILSNYIQQFYQGQQQGYKTAAQPYPTQNVGYQPQDLSYQAPNLVYQGHSGYPAYQQEQNYEQPPVETGANLPTHENYPDDAHTRVIYHGPKGHIPSVSYSSSSNQYSAPQSTYSAVQQSYAAPQQTYLPKAAEQAYTAPQQTYSAPQQTYTAPQQAYTASQQAYTAPQQTYSSQHTYSMDQVTHSTPQSTYTASQPIYSNTQQYSTPQVTYDGASQTYGASQSSYPAPQQSYETPQQNYAAQENYDAVPQTSYTEQNPNTQYVYTDSHGQNYIYVNPSQLGQYQQSQQEYQQQGQDYQSEDQSYQTSYEDDNSNPQYLPATQTQDTSSRQYLPATETEDTSSRQYLPAVQSNADKIFNYHAHTGKDTKERSKKASGSPVIFDQNAKAIANRTAATREATKKEASKPKRKQAV